MAATRALLLAVVSMAALLGTALGASYTVGAPSGSWDLKTNYTRWASGVKLYAGDQLRFQYIVAEHNVVEVTKSGYDACNGSNNTVATYQTGNDTIPLTAAGSRYFICGVPGHCAAGMKLQVNVSSQQTPPPPPPPQQQCRMRKGKLRCNRPASPSSSASAAAAVDRSAVAWQRLAAVVVAAHDVVEVTKDGYLPCTESKNISGTLRTGQDTVGLYGLRMCYFMCSVQGHCAASVKLLLRVVPPGCDSPSPVVTNRTAR
ncbi:hypothetical protein QYE76_033163 [Lolium multiflorum]|uniref:Phytocyanin domain-containing protein n=1 Tax=Lolium multiflorum TaxID=4521 RepID=A0AAD8QW60_LOLMU|nr:hypothetical protein QYE76_033163 [Lolium multiflorum]